MIKAVIFDVGGVLIRTEDWRHRRELEIQHGLSRGDADEIVFNSETGTQAQLGHIRDVDLWRWVAQRLKLSEEDLADFRQRFWAGDQLDQVLIQAIRELKKNYQTAIISNATDALRRTIDEKYGFSDAFDLIVCSAEEKVMKPDKAIYNRALEKLACEPEETIFVDDNLANIKAAKRLGINAILFTPQLDWKYALSEAGVKFSLPGELPDEI